MYESLGTVTLKTGETVDCGLVRGPDADWAPHLNRLLGHKWDPWNWQNAQCLTSADLGIDSLFYVLHRDGKPFSNILLATLDGVGTFGHVFTLPEDRRKHATSQLMAKQMAHFRRTAPGGRALYLGTGYDSPAYHIYKDHGFVGIEPKSGVMDYYVASRQAFEMDYFGRASDPTVIEPMGWRHWPTSSPLTCAAFGGAGGGSGGSSGGSSGGGVVRMAGPRLIGRVPAEEAALLMIRRNLHAAKHGTAPEALALRNKRTDAVLGMASWQWDAMWPGVVLVDVYCHPDHWGRAGDLLAPLRLPGAPEAVRTIAYADTLCQPKLDALGRAGFTKAQVLPKHVPVDAARSRAVDVMVLEKKPT